MKKAFGQTVRDLKREVNKKVLKVPGVEQKVLDATSNEPWGPHGSHLADIAQATRNYHEYQMIMAVIWKRINDTGKNWRHVYKALTVLEYLVAHGSERVIDEIKEHAYQISTLSDFQYIDSSGRDQGSNVRKKSQSLVVLVNDKERIQEVRQKAATNRDKFRNTTGGMPRPSSQSNMGGYGDRYDDDRYEGRYGSRDDDRNGYGREKEGGYKDDDRYGRNGDSYGRDGDHYSRDSEERYGRDGDRDDDYRGRSRSTDGYQYGSRSRSSDRDRDRAYEDDGQYSSRGSGAKADDQSQDGSYESRPIGRKFSEQNLSAPPSYEEAVGDSQNGRDGETSAASIPKASSPTVSSVPNQATSAVSSSEAPAPALAPAPANKEVDAFDEFDPRGSFSGAPTTSNGAEMDLLGSLSDPFSSNSLAIVVTTSEADAAANFGSGPSFVASPSASTATNQPFEDPFGDGPFRAIPTTESAPGQPPNFGATSSLHSSGDQGYNPVQPASTREDTVNNFGLGDTFSGISYSSNVPQFSQEPSPTHQDIDILADILPPSGPSPPVASQAASTVPSGQPASQSVLLAQSVQPASQTGFLSQTGQSPMQTGFPTQAGQPASLTGFPPSNVQPVPPSSGYYGNYLPQSGLAASVAPNMASQAPAVTANQHPANILQQTGFAVPVPSQGFQTPITQQNSDFTGNLLPQARPTTAAYSQPAVTASTGALAIVPQPAKDKFEPKSSVWADTLSRGLVNFNISGPKTNPLADIGVDFDAINRKEKRMEKPSATPVTSTTTMGKAMGSGSGIGRAGASAIRAPPNPMMGSNMGMGLGGGPSAGMGMSMGMSGGPSAGMGMGMGGGPSAGMGVGGYGGMNQPMGMGMGGGPSAGMGVGGYGGMNQPMGMGGAPGMGMGIGGYGGTNQPMGMGMGMGMNMPANMGMGMNSMGQGVQMQQPTGFPPGSMPGGYNPAMGPGGYAPQQPYGGGYR